MPNAFALPTAFEGMEEIVSIDGTSLQAVKDGSWGTPVLTWKQIDLGPDSEKAAVTRNETMRAAGAAGGRLKGSIFPGARDDGGARAFFESVDCVGGKVAEFFEEAAWPADLHSIDFGEGAEAEVDAHVAVGNVAGAAADFVHESARAGFHGDFRADAIAIGFDADRAERNPMIAVADVIDEKRRNTIHVADDRGNAAVIP